MTQHSKDNPCFLASRVLITSLIPPPISQASAQLRGQDVPVWQGQFQVLMTCLNQIDIYSKLLRICVFRGGQGEWLHKPVRPPIHLQQLSLPGWWAPGSI